MKLHAEIQSGEYVTYKESVWRWLALHAISLILTEGANLQIQESLNSGTVYDSFSITGYISDMKFDKAHEEV